MTDTRQALAAQPVAGAVAQPCKAGGQCRWRGAASAELVAQHEAAQAAPAPEPSAQADKLLTQDQIDRIVDFANEFWTVGAMGKKGGHVECYCALVAYLTSLAASPKPQPEPSAQGEPVTLTDVLDALNVFNKPRPSEGDEPWTENDFISVKHLPDFINIIAVAWFAPSTPCRKCGGVMKPGQAMGQTVDCSDEGTMSPAGPGKLIPCMKCSACGWSVTGE